MERCGQGSRRGESFVERRFSWLSVRPLLDSRNQVISRVLGDPTNDRRRAWLRAMGRGPGDDFVVDLSTRDPVSFLVLGDTGEGDASQYAVIAPLLSQAAGTAFLFLLSDVIYPAGGSAEYGTKLFCPYRDYPGALYGIPGNHDWYDGGEGFMRWFCGAEHPPRAPGGGVAGWLRNRLWRDAPSIDREAVARIARLRDARPPQIRQPGPYFAIDTGPIRLIGLDTGMGGKLDADQAAWLRRVSAGPRPKLLLTGKPIYVDGQHNAGELEGGGAIDGIVTDPRHNYLGAIGGDIHNYQRHLVERDGRRLAYIVSGGGGAFMHATHTIPNLDHQRLAGVRERDFRCYPLRGDSLSRFSELYGRKLGRLGRNLTIPPDEAAAIVADRIRLEPTRPSAREVTPSDRRRRTADVLFKVPSRGRGPLHLPFAEFLDWNEPPMFKHFLRVDARFDEIRVRCFAATGCRDAEDDPPVEDELVATPGPDGAWSWTST